MIDARGQPVQIAADDVKLDLIESSRAGGRAKQDFPAGVGFSLGNAAAIIEKPCQVLQVGNRLGPALRIIRQQARQSREIGVLPSVGQGNAVQVGVDLEWLRPVGPIQGMGAGPDTVIGVLGLLVILPRGFGIAVGHGARGPSCAAWRRLVHHSECL